MADGPDTTLDPDDWRDLRAAGHRILDDMFDHLEGIRARPVWQPMPDSAHAALRQPLPRGPGSLDDAYATLQQAVIPYTVGNPHPGFMGWVHGAGTPIGMLAELMAGALNANVGGRNQAPVEVERQVSGWMAGLFGFPEAARGIFVTGTSIANFMGVVVARTALLGRDVRADGLAEHGRLRAYTSAEAHGCIAKAMDMAGFGTDALRQVAADAQGRMDLLDLRAQVAADRDAGLYPFLLVATAGTVNTGAIDPLDDLADFARAEGLWLHVDGAYAALGMLAPDVAPLLHGIARADSLAFDFHKWGQVPYDAGYFMARDGAHMLDAFAAPAAYLQRAGRGLAAGDAWPCDVGPDLSRGFRALKTWLTFQVYGADAIGAAISASCALARRLAARVEAAPELELLAPVALNIVCFRYVCPDAERVNREIVLALYDEGQVAPSATTIGGHYAIRAALVNHRTGDAETDTLVASVLRLGRALSIQQQESLAMIDPSLIDAAVTPYAPLIGAATLMRCAFRNDDLRPLGDLLLARARANPDDANAWLDASFVLQLVGQRELGLDVQHHALATNALYTLPAPGVEPGGAPALKVLVFMGPGDFMANTPIEFLLETSNIAAQVQYLTLDLPLPEQVPDHDVLFVAIAQSDANAPLLRDAMQMLDGWPRPVVNRPEAIAELSRDGAFARLAGATGTLMPRTVRVERNTVQRLAAGEMGVDALLPGAAFPLIVRPLDSHAGTDLQRVADAAALADYLGSQGSGEYYLAPFIDYSGTDGQFRKYRIVLIDGKPFICHLAISSHWMVHYLNAGMDDSADKRAEEAREMAAFDTGFAVRHAAALADIDARIGLPYLGIDCAETRDGKLLIFEVDNAMVVHAMDEPAKYGYKGPVMQKVFTAFAGMLQRAARG